MAREDITSGAAHSTTSRSGRRAELAAVAAYLLSLLYLFGVIVSAAMAAAAFLHGGALTPDGATVRFLFNDLVNPAMSAGLAVSVVYMAHAGRRRRDGPRQQSR